MILMEMLVDCSVLQEKFVWSQALQIIILEATVLLVTLTLKQIVVYKYVET
ncbi:MAG: hypothetical protein AAGJ08_20635 [Cyanobacteria bacterium P01_H01_bin.35]